MQAFIVAHNAYSQIEEARNDGHQDDSCKDDNLVCDTRQGREDRTFKPILFFGAHKSLLIQNV